MTHPLTPDDMKKMAFKNSKYLKLADGESAICTLLKCETIPSSRDPEKETYRYTLAFDSEDGVSKKYFESASNVLLRIMSDCMNKKIEIIRHGTGTDTKYEVNLIIE